LRISVHARCHCYAGCGLLYVVQHVYPMRKVNLKHWSNAEFVSEVGIKVFAVSTGCWCAIFTMMSFFMMFVYSTCIYWCVEFVREVGIKVSII
jgi:hypothetical protein